MLAELVSFSGGAINSPFCKLKELPGIISLIGCGIVQAHYAFKNISDKSETTIKYFIAMLRFVLWKIFLRLMTHFSSTMDCIIFLYLGMAVLEAVQVPLSLFQTSCNQWVPVLVRRSAQAGGTLGSSCGPSSSAFSSASLEFTSSPSWPTSENNILDQSQVLILQVPSEADQPAGAVHHGLRGAAQWSWFLSCQDGQQVCETRIVEIVNIVTW